MFDDIRGDTRNSTLVSYVVAACAIIITTACLMVPELKALYGVTNELWAHGIVRLTIPFQHGFDDLSAVLHLIINLIFMWFFGTYLEKVIGSFRFLFITMVSWGVFVLVHRSFSLIGHGLTPIIMTYSGVMMFVLIEGKFVKTRSVFEDYYRTLRLLMIVLWVGFPVLMAFVPIYYDSSLTGADAVFYGNIAHISGLILGLILGFVFRGHIRSKMVQRTRKRYIKHGKLDDLAFYAALVIPLYLIFVFLIRPA